MAGRRGTEFVQKGGEKACTAFVDEKKCEKPRFFFKKTLGQLVSSRHATEEAEICHGDAERNFRCRRGGESTQLFVFDFLELLFFFT